VLTPADEEHHIDKWAFTVPFVCGARNLGEALRWGSVNASAVLQGIGAQKGLLGREQLEKNLANPPAPFVVEPLA